MLTENEVVLFMCDWLKTRGYTVKSYKLNTSPGHDIEAVSPAGLTICIECKGAKSPRSGKAFDLDYQWRAAAGALFNAVVLKEKKKRSIDVAIALPKIARYSEFMESLREFCKREEIKVYWVSSQDTINEWQDA